MADERLIDPNVDVADDAMPDYLYAMMLNVEEAFKYAGAKAGKDYNYKDLMEFAIKIYQTNKPDSIAFSMPYKKPE